MHPIRYFLYAAALIITSPQFVSSDGYHGAVHIVLPNGEEQVDCGGAMPGDSPNCPWYLHESFDYYYGDRDDPSNELEYDTMWPGQREDFSDYFMR